MAWTKEQRAEYMKSYREANKQRLSDNRRYYYKLHKEKELSYSNEYIKKWRADNRDKYNEYQRIYRKRIRQR